MGYHSNRLTDPPGYILIPLRPVFRKAARMRLLLYNLIISSLAQNLPRFSHLTRKKFKVLTSPYVIWPLATSPILQTTTFIYHHLRWGGQKFVLGCSYAFSGDVV